MHFPTTSNIPIDVPTLIDVYLGSMEEIKYDREEMKRRHLSIVMNQGEDVWVLPRIMNGTRCAYWNSEEENCSSPLDQISPCYNTGWVGGYHYPILLKVVIPPADRSIVTQDAGVRNEYNMRPWTMPTPKLQERMLMVRRYSGRRYEVQNVTDVRWRGNSMHQEFDLREITRGASSFAYNVPVPVP